MVVVVVLVVIVVVFVVVVAVVLMIIILTSLAVFANPKSWDWWRSNSGFWDCTKLLNWYF